MIEVGSMFVFLVAFAIALFFPVRVSIPLFLAFAFAIVVGQL